MKDIDHTNWREFALCAQIDIGDIFYPELGENAHQAKRICATCPAAKWCLQEALETGEPHGVWGGTTPKERRRMRGQKVA